MIFLAEYSIYILAIGVLVLLTRKPPVTIKNRDMAIARIFVGAHWPHDIFGGAILGIGTAIVCNNIYKKYKHKIGL